MLTIDVCFSDLRARVKTLRDLRGINTEDMSLQMGVHYNTVRVFLNGGDIKPDSLRKMEAWCDANACPQS